MPVKLIGTAALVLQSKPLMTGTCDSVDSSAATPALRSVTECSPTPWMRRTRTPTRSPLVLYPEDYTPSFARGCLLISIHC